MNSAMRKTVGDGEGVRLEWYSAEGEINHPPGKEPMTWYRCFATADGEKLLTCMCYARAYADPIEISLAVEEQVGIRMYFEEILKAPDVSGALIE